MNSHRLETAVEVVKKLGPFRAIEASSPAQPPIPNPLGLVGVDYDRGSYRARIRCCDALSGVDRRVTLGRSLDPNEAAQWYKIAHVALYGSFSWAAEDLSSAEKFVISETRKQTTKFD